jgi:DNA-binding HxlR family transcriptional regulator
VRSAELIQEQCSIARTVALLGDRWTLVVLRDAFMGVRRFEDFQSSVGISRSLLADRLARLVEAGILRREPYKDTTRTREEYRLTQKGIDFYPVLRALADWGDTYQAEDGPFLVYRHKGCGGTSEFVHRCTQCGADGLTARDIRAEPGPGARAA